ncbi:30S ribosomal protein S12 methylthiotransferase RimO [Granulosicoccus antarcticus]|uniref:Ribosomal protein uS12 methylthiotransferase RimO n=1 Tax=Granulosicoccus antarcticus IMCC3135 TaxID=1192854 RepID=A0A2Z2NTI5_9GAMM|nr:30S ribosomal protein S12 methylthiotransferase RimO [Granulosicoccus antarcticus]ASJ74629.1 Ribosomal protein S12 methylthiotransferase RimO [Granulosicoccus antarcticus IMCC3135]
MSTNPKVGFVSLGCPKALVDSERILTQLRTDGYDVVPDYQSADLVVVNTCGFIDSAVAESMEAIGEALDENGRVIVTGCLGVKAEDIQAKYPKVLAVTGPQAYEEVVGAVHQHLPHSYTHDPFIDLVPPQGIKLTPRHYAYLKISEGCNHRCSFCIIPSMRGDLVSRDIGDVMAEAERLKAAGVRELLIISQDTSAYGVDIRYRTAFWNGRPIKTRMKELCEALGELGIWVRLHYVYPYPHVDNIIPLMAEGKILPYLDIPFQHASPKILKSMKRPAASENNLTRIKAWREICPELTIRSTFIAGFPGETDDDFEQLLDFLDEAQLDRVGCFAYSPVDGAKANQLENQVPEELKQERLQRFMEKQAAISAQRLQSKVGTRQIVLLDSVGEQQAIARSYSDAPEIDGVVHIAVDDYEIEAGDFIEVDIVSADEHDLFGKIVGE